MTKKEIKLRAEIKKSLQTKGLLPPNKKKLNRKKFIDETREQWLKRDRTCFKWEFYIMRALVWMTSYTDNRGNISPEAVGAAKVYKIALRFKEFEEEIQKSGQSAYTVGELYESVKEIMEA